MSRDPQSHSFSHWGGKKSKQLIKRSLYELDTKTRRRTGLSRTAALNMWRRYLRAPPGRQTAPPAGCGCPVPGPGPPAVRLVHPHSAPQGTAPRPAATGHRFKSLLQTLDLPFFLFFLCWTMHIKVDSYELCLMNARRTSHAKSCCGGLLHCVILL
jgi:hypothetical protein